MAGWSLSKTNGSVLLPLSPKSYHHSLVLYSESPARPLLSFPPDLVTLGIAWNGTAVYGVLNPLQKDLQDPLPPHFQIDITLSCLAEGVVYKCEVLAGERLINIGTLSLWSSPAALRVMSRPGEELFVVMHRPSLVTHERTYPRQERRGGKERTTDFYIEISILCFVFSGIIFVVLYSSITRSRHIKMQKHQKALLESLPEEEEPFMPHRESPKPLPRGSIIMTPEIGVHGLV
ncbi:hypothetical protein SK128_013133 [Halocaridina rubra]|uniref:Uncharacterized protein n=1 Tax=Halocaridina rubra TaxID=373956 RepID=A0AAN8XNT3_HALRR